MAELLKIEVTEKDLRDGILPQNYVMTLMDYTAEGASTKSGIIYGINTELVYADGDNPDDNSSHAADLAEVSSVVVKVPQKLYFNPDDEKGMNWECNMELEVGDRIWTNVIETLNAVCLVCGDKVYKLIPYSDIYCAKRGDTVIMINGFVLCRQKYVETISELDITSGDRICKDRGIVAYLGKPNKRYRTTDYMDFLDLREGDEILWDRKYAAYLLERQTYASRFNDKELFWVVPRRRIVAVLNREL